LHHRPPRWPQPQPRPLPATPQALLQYGFVLGNEPPALSRSDAPGVGAGHVYSSLNEMEPQEFDGAVRGNACRKGAHAAAAPPSLANRLPMRARHLLRRDAPPHPGRVASHLHYQPGNPAATRPAPPPTGTPKQLGAEARRLRGRIEVLEDAGGAYAAAKLAPGDAGGRILETLRRLRDQRLQALRLELATVTGRLEEERAEREDYGGTGDEA
jgi:hypothetical protein